MFKYSTYTQITISWYTVDKPELTIKLKLI